MIEVYATEISVPTSGPVAQLGARFHGMEEVVGSIPTRSTNFKNVWPAHLSAPRLRREGRRLDPNQAHSIHLPFLQIDSRVTIITDKLDGLVSH